MYVMHALLNKYAIKSNEINLKEYKSIQVNAKSNQIKIDQRKRRWCRVVRFAPSQFTEVYLGTG